MGMTRQVLIGSVCTGLAGLLAGCESGAADRETQNASPLESTTIDAVDPRMRDLIRNSNTKIAGGVATFNALHDHKVGINRDENGAQTSLFGGYFDLDLRELTTEETSQLDQDINGFGGGGALNMPGLLDKIVPVHG